MKKINASILGLVGGQDQGIPVDDVQKFAATLKQMGKKVDITVYPDAGHGFENPNNTAGYRAKDAADARERTQKFFASTLKK